MTEEKISKGRGRSALVTNLLQLAVFIVFEVILYRLISYRNYLVFDYVPMKYVIIAEVVLVIANIVPFVLKWGKKSRIVSIVLSVLLIILMASAEIAAYINDARIKDMMTKTDETIEKVVQNSRLSTDEYGVYVLTENTAQTLQDAKDYTFGYSSTYSAEDSTTVLDAIKTELDAEIRSQKHTDVTTLAQNLLEGQVETVILNQSMLDLIASAGDDTDDGKQNGMYADFTDKIRCIYTVNIKNVVKTKKDKGGITEHSFYVYISGIDTDGPVTARSRSDVNIIMSVNPTTHQIVLVSTPRDYYVPLSISGGVRDKLTHAGNYGVDVSVDTLDMLYDINIDYFVRMNFTGFVNIIDALGGVDVNSDYAFSTHGYSYTEGLNQNLSGIEALWFARERHAFAEGDKQRGRDQMKVIEAVIRKLQSSALLKNYDEIMDNISESFQTNMTEKSIKSLVKFQLKESPKWKVFTYSVSGMGSKNYTYSSPGARAYVMEPDESTIEKAKALFQKNSANKTIKKKDVESGTQ